MSDTRTLSWLVVVLVCALGCRTPQVSPGASPAPAVPSKVAEARATCPGLSSFLVVVPGHPDLERPFKMSAIGRVPEGEVVWVFGNEDVPCRTTAGSESVWESQPTTELVGACSIMTFPVLAFRQPTAGDCRMAPATWQGKVPDAVLEPLPINPLCTQPACVVWTTYHIARAGDGTAAMSVVASERYPDDTLRECEWPTKSHWLKFLSRPGKPLQPLRLEGDLLGVVEDGGRPVALVIVSVQDRRIELRLSPLNESGVSETPFVLSYLLWEAKGGYAPASRSSCSP